jgi:hypothetical protein
MMNLSLEEQETHLNMTAADRDTWYAYSVDKVMQRKLERVGAELVRIMPDGIGKEYKLRADQLSFRRGKRQLSESAKAQLATRMRTLRKITVLREEK